MATYDIVAACISDELQVDPARVTPTTSLGDDLGATSLAIVELMVAIEEKVGIAVSDDEIANIATVGDILDIVRTHLPDHLGASTG